MSQPQPTVAIKTVTVTVEPDRDITVDPDPKSVKTGEDVEWSLTVKEGLPNLAAYVMPLETVALIPDDQFEWNSNHGMYLKTNKPPHARAHKNPGTAPKTTHYRISVVFEDKPDMPRTLIGSVLIVE